jgi:YegS/Rv2252/BmrU family lipid kinase
MKKIRFIINPKSGTGKNKNLTALIDSEIDKNIFETDIAFTQAQGHACELAREAVALKYDIVVAVGGDGSVNETAGSLINTSTSLGIIPTGSGNGMARHLKVPVDIKKALANINTGKIDTIDTLEVNNRFCIGTIGIGFDAHIAHLFAHAGKRGYSTYVKLVLTEFASYKEKRFVILVDGKTYERDCFLLTIANSSQFGNNAMIAPFADVKDGVIDISAMKRFPFFVAPSLIYRLMHNTIHLSRYFELLKGREIIIKNNVELQGHIDGEPVLFNSDLNISIHRDSLKVIIPAI